MSDDLDVLLQEHRKFEPDPAFRAQANVSDPAIYDRAAADPEGYWAEQAATLEWSKPFTQRLDWKPPHATWFADGQLNASVNCIDRHIRSARRNKAALVFEGEPGDRRTLTYWDLYVAVNQFANVLKSLGVVKGDRVAIYLPLIP
jgi:acetyl-CoA synthetase